MNYKENYKLQDKILQTLGKRIPGFYLTGGTALSRYYLNHRFSEDLDFFADNISDYTKQVLSIRKMLEEIVHVSHDKIIQYDSFSRIWVSDDVELKIELVNDVGAHWGTPLAYNGINIDNPANILANKLTALLSRDEPKDVFDIVTISENYSFNWDEVFTHAISKAVINEPDVAMRLREFPVGLFDEKHWLKQAINKSDFEAHISIIAGDFIMARDNSLGMGKPKLTEAKPELMNK